MQRDPALGGEGRDHPLDLVDGTGVDEHVPQLGDPVGVEVGLPEQLVHQRQLVGVGGVEGERHEHGALALAQVVAGGLAGRRRVTEDPEHVVAQLERLAQRQAVVGEVVEVDGRRHRPPPRR